MTRFEQIDGTGGVCFDADGSVKLVVGDELADLFDQAAKLGISADELLTRILDDAARAKANASAINENAPLPRRSVLCDRPHVELRHGTVGSSTRSRHRRTRVFS